MIMILEYMSEYFGMFLGALALLIVQAICDLSLPDYMADIVNLGVINGNVNYIVQTGGKMILITLLSAACTIVTGYFASRIAANTARDMRADIFKRVQTFFKPRARQIFACFPHHPDHQRYHPDPAADCLDGAHGVLFGHHGHRRGDQGQRRKHAPCPGRSLERCLSILVLIICPCSTWCCPKCASCKRWSIA